MSNPTTAAEWKQVAAEADAQLKEIRAQSEAATAEAKATVAAAEAEYKRLRQAARTENFNLQTPEGKAAFDAARAAATAGKAAVEEAKRAEDRAYLPFLEKTNQLLSTRNNALQQEQFALAGAPNTSTNTAPANPAPGDNTAVTTTAAAPVDNSTPPATQQYSNRPQQTVAEETPVVQKTVEAVPDTQPQVTQQVPDPQKSIAINTAGLPVVAEDGTVSNKTNINPETGQLYTPIPANEISQDPSAKGSSRGLQTATKRARAQATSQDASYLSRLPDWRVKLQLAEGATYLYKSPTDAGILQPLQETEGVVFPYTPSIQVQYGAHYDPTELTHSNYKVFQYKNSSVDNISITADFTAQDTYEARYLLAVIHFFRSVTKMFYGNDLNPRNGTPPPLCYLTGFGEFNFNQHPLAITNFTYTLPNDVDYIRANTEANSPPGVNQSAANSPNNTGNPTTERTTSSGIQPGGKSLGPKFNIDPSKYQTGAKDPTYVPTKMQIQLTAVPIMSRNVISTKFSLKDYASGKLLQGSKQPGVKGVW